MGQLTEIVDVAAGEAERGEVFNGLLEAADQKVIAPGRKPADEKFKSGDVGGFAGHPIAGGHRQLIEIRKERAQL